MNLLTSVHPEWLEALSGVIPDIQKIENALSEEDFQPPSHQVLRALEYPLSEVRVVIFGQDPYPTPGHAMGLAFSVSSNVKPIPMSLRNIFAELASDLNCAAPTNGDLSRWAKQGVALVNRLLTVPTGKSNGHQGLGWEVVTAEIAGVLGKKDVVAILWGNNARGLAHLFRDEWVISSAHPSPLSAHRGFFGSKPFSKANSILSKNQLREILWQ